MSVTQSPELIESLYRISSLAGKVKSPREALEIVMDELCRATGTSRGSIALLDPNNGRLRIEAHRGLPEDCGAASLRLGEGLTGWVALQGEAVVVPDVSADPRYRSLAEEVRSEMVAPLKNRDQIIGVVSMDADRTNAFDRESLDRLQALTSETAALLGQLWLIDNLKAKSRHLEAVLTVGQGIVSRLDQRQILDSITQGTVPMSGCRLCAIHLLNEDQTMLIPHAMAGGETGRKHPDLPVNETSAGVALHRRKQIEVTEMVRTEALLPLLEFARAEGLVSLLCTPILFEDRVLGILSAYTGNVHRFSDDEHKLFQAMGSLGAVAIHNAGLYERVFQSEETLREQEKLTTLGLLAAEIAHEVRNPLTVLKLLFSSLDLEFPPEDPRRKDIEVIGEKLNELETTVGRVLTFARPAAEPHALCRLDDVAGDTLQLLRLKAEQAGVQVSFAPNLNTPTIRGDKGQLQQALLNLLLNSLQAVENGGGHIQLRCGAETLDGTTGAFLEIEDNGPGIAENFQPDIFKSLLTGRTGGTGLGLGIVKRIVDGHGGRIDLVRTGPNGTVMKMWLPSET